MAITREEMVTLLDRRTADWQDRDPESLAADYAETAVVESPMTGHSVGREAIRATYGKFLAAFGDLRIVREHVLIDGDRAVVVFTFTGTHTGLLFGMQGAGEALVFRGVSVYKVADGQIVHEQRIFDFTGFLMNLGIITARPAGDR
jgi:steroid delta-isomerase-like uncharacterized protein